MAVAFECPECRTAWPHYRNFASCPECGVVCRATVTPRALTPAQAKTRLLRMEFERYYAAREYHRVGPSPEAIGAAEARAEIARIHELNETLNDDDPGD